MTKLEDAEEMLEAICDDTPGWPRQLSKEEAKAIADELDRLRSALEYAEERAEKNYNKMVGARNERDAARAELAALKGEAERTVYLCDHSATSAESAVGGVLMGYWTGTRPVDAKFAVRLSARKVEP